nr:MAG TPA: hypothetical protein [Caudoviricetes sp.]
MESGKYFFCKLKLLEKSCEKKIQLFLKKFLTFPYENGIINYRTEEVGI